MFYRMLVLFLNIGIIKMLFFHVVFDKLAGLGQVSSFCKIE
jgi:hypothetical protein